MLEQGSASTSTAQQMEVMAQMSDANNAAALRANDAAQRLDRLAAQMQQVVAVYSL
ncbi:hypothetical protein OL229_07935 [Neisseriaceae bacterium JH1-16]|nr:hypothetical protein [Neisseriaceae bacterium JH1-16]